jgi:hypothetical protein
MKKLLQVSVFACILLLELFVSFKLTPVPVNLAKQPYRREQRAAAFQAYAKDRLPEQAATYREEVRLASRQVMRTRLVGTEFLFGGFLVVDAVVIFRWKYNRKREGVVDRVITLAIKGVIQVRIPLELPPGRSHPGCHNPC